MVNATEKVRSKWVVFQDVLISVSLPGPLIDEEWNQFLKDLRTQPITKYLSGSLGRTETSSIQRKQSADILKSRGIRTAVVTDDAFVRGVVTAVGWLGANVDAFPWSKPREALQYLGVTGSTADLALDVLSGIRRDLEGPANRKT